MNTFTPAELSALLDGELAPDRARQVEEMLVTDASLRAEFESLRQSDIAFREAARTAAFPISVLFPDSIAAPRAAVGTVAMLALTLVAVKMAPKFVDGFAFGVALHGIALAVVLLGVVWVISQQTAHA